VQQWLHAELEKPLDPADVARAGTSAELAAEMYQAAGHREPATADPAP
jgi:uncharacterized membrane protein YebE (DUF533 family)